MLPWSLASSERLAANYDTAMKIVAYIEIAVLARLLLGLLIRQSSILSVVVYIHFIRMRFIQSLYTRDAFAHINKVVSGHVATAPPVAQQGWGYVQNGCKWFVATKAMEQQPTNVRRQSGAK